jgi:hypothetical protein
MINSYYNYYIHILNYIIFIPERMFQIIVHLEKKMT